MEVYTLFSCTGAANHSVHSTLAGAQAAFAAALHTLGVAYNPTLWVGNFGGVQYSYPTTEMVEGVYIVRTNLDGDHQLG